MPKRGVKLSGRSGSKFGGKDADTGSEKRKAAQLKGKAVAGKGKGEYSVSDLVAKAEHFMDSLEPALALKFYLR